MALRVLLAGDSLAVGLAAPLGAIAKQRGFEFRADGRTNTRLRDWIKNGWLVQDVGEFNPDLTLISLGTNDMKADLSTFKTDLVTLIAQATTGTGAHKVAWIGPPRQAFDLDVEGKDKSSVRQDLLKVLTPRGINIFPSNAGGADYARSADQIHMTPAGYAAWAQDIAAWAHFAENLYIADTGIFPGEGTKAAAMSGGRRIAIGLGIAVLLVGLGALGVMKRGER